MTAWIQDVTDDDFEKEVIERSRELPVVVDFWAAWCGPCRVLGPVLERLAIEGNGRFLLAKVDVDRSPRKAQEFSVRGIPAVMAFRDGKIAAEFTGALPEDAVRQFLQKVCPSEADTMVEKAEAAPESSEEREALYLQALDLDPAHPAAMLGLAETLLARGAIAETRELVSKLAPGGALAERIDTVRAALQIREDKPDASEAELRRKLDGGADRGAILIELGRLLAAEARYSEALEAFYEAAQSSPKLARGEAKERMVHLFRVIGVRSPLADEYRTRLSRLLY